MDSRLTDGDDTTMCTVLDEKACQIEVVLGKATVDLWELRELALTEGGLINDSIRQRAWPALVGLHSAALGPRKATAASSSAGDSDHNDDSCRLVVPNVAQVELDVTRCTWHLLTGTQRIQRLQMEHKRNKRIARVIRKKQRRLAWCIQRSLESSTVPLHYYQGYHDIACIFLSTLRDAAPPSTWMLPSNNNNSPSRQRQPQQTPPPSTSLDLPSAVLLQVSQSHLLDCMQETFKPLQTCLTLTIFPLVALLDPEVHQHLTACDMAPFFALPWVLTWFSHEIRDTALVKRLFDAFLASHPALPIYVCVAMLLHPFNRAQILETECDFAAVHHTLAGLPKNSSAFGWKYHPGQGYVSDHEDIDGDSDSVQSCSSFDRMDSDDVGAEGEMMLLKEGLLEKNPSSRVVGALPMKSSTEDVVSVSSSLSLMHATTISTDEAAKKVPFQELLDTAVRYVHRIPPRRLLSLAKQFYGNSYVEEQLSSAPAHATTSSSSFSAPELPLMLQDPVSWVLSPTAPAEWWLRSRVRETRGLAPRAPRNNHYKRNVQQQHQQKLRHRKLLSMSSLGSSQSHDDCMPPASESNDFTQVPPKEFVKLLRRRRDRRAPLASGMALSIPEEKRKKSRERAMVLIAGLIVLYLALGDTTLRWWSPTPAFQDQTKRANSESLEARPRRQTTANEILKTRSKDTHSSTNAALSTSQQDSARKEEEEACPAPPL